MTPFDPGSVLLAGSAASIASWAVLAWFPRAHRVRHVPEAVHISVGVCLAFVFAWLWSFTGWPIAPLQGGLFGVLLWLSLELLVTWAARRRAGRSDLAAAFLAALVYGVLLGFAYLPGA